MSCENKFGLQENTKIVHDKKGNPIGIATSNTNIIRKLERQLETADQEPKEIGIYLNLE
ncbi:MAG: hypothetical protein HY425_01360 [Candidatus Levybacteria bacterium]|nr:hypothetical protein [Candidatus Levybacteria bacterium]